MVNFIFYLRILSYFVILSSIGGPCLPKPRRGLRSQAPDAFGLNPPNYRLSLVSISESGSQKSLVSNSLRMLNIRPTISQKLKIFKFGAISVSEHCPSLGTEKSHNSKNFERHIAKIRNLIFIRFRTLRNFLDQRRAAPFIGYH